MHEKIEDPLRYPVQAGRRIRSGQKRGYKARAETEHFLSRVQDGPDQEAARVVAPRTEGRGVASKDPGEVFCGICGKKVPPRSIMVGPIRCARHRGEYAVSAAGIAATTARVPRTKNDPGLVIWCERQPIEPEPEQPRAPHWNQPALTADEEAIARERANGTLRLTADRIQTERRLKSYHVAETLATIEIVSKMKLVPLPHQEELCPDCGEATHAEGMCKAAQAFASQDNVPSTATPLRTGWIAPRGRIGWGHGTGASWDWAYRPPKKRDPIAKEAAERVAKLKAERKLRTRLAEMAASDQGASSARQQEAHRLVRIEGLSQHKAGRRMGISQPGVRGLLEKYDRNRPKESGT